MKRTLTILAILSVLLISACTTAEEQPQAVDPTPVVEVTRVNEVRGSYVYSETSTFIEEGDSTYVESEQSWSLITPTPTREVVRVNPAPGQDTVLTPGPDTILMDRNIESILVTREFGEKVGDNPCIKLGLFLSCRGDGSQLFYFPSSGTLTLRGIEGERRASINGLPVFLLTLGDNVVSLPDNSYLEVFLPRDGTVITNFHFRPDLR